MDEYLSVIVPSLKVVRIQLSGFPVYGCVYFSFKIVLKRSEEIMKVRKNC